VQDRRAIQSGSVGVTRFWFTLFGLYRVLESPFDPKLKTITDSFSGDPDFLRELTGSFAFWTDWCFPLYLKRFGEDGLSDLYPCQSPLIKTASPNGKVSWESIDADWFTWTKSPRRSERLREYLDVIRSATFPKQLGLSFMRDSGILRASFDSPSPFEWDSGPPPFVVKPSIKSKSDLRLGQLSFKEEAAGKLRVFAMVDNITQVVLSPLHDVLFNILSQLPNDGTFDQDASVLRCRSKMEVSKCAYSFDLSAATDRLPVQIQVSILDGMFPEVPGLGNAWRNLLIDRDYVIPSNPYGISEGSLRYSVGQPMGALSSWAMLALTHHLLIQYCFRTLNNRNISKPKGFWYTNYEVLGDDVVIFDHDVATAYLEVMARLGVDINMSKSISSRDGTALEFAKRTIFQGVDVSGLSWRLFSVADQTLSGRLTIMLDYLRRGSPLTRYKVQAILGWSERNLQTLSVGGSRLRSLKNGVNMLLGYFLKELPLEHRLKHLGKPTNKSVVSRDPIGSQLPVTQMIDNLIQVANIAVSQPDQLSSFRPVWSRDLERRLTSSALIDLYHRDSSDDLMNIQVELRDLLERYIRGELIPPLKAFLSYPGVWYSWRDGGVPDPRVRLGFWNDQSWYNQDDDLKILYSQLCEAIRSPFGLGGSSDLRRMDIDFVLEEILQLQTIRDAFLGVVASQKLIEVDSTPLNKLCKKLSYAQKRYDKFPASSSEDAFDMSDFQ
jgi:hypothetical protein